MIQLLTNKLFKMKKILGLFLMLFALSTVVATASTLVKQNLKKEVFISKEKLATIEVIQTKVEMAILDIPDKNISNEIHYTIKSNVFAADPFSNKETEVQNKDVVWLTNMKSK